MGRYLVLDFDPNDVVVREDGRIVVLVREDAGHPLPAWVALCQNWATGSVGTAEQFQADETGVVQGRYIRINARSLSLGRPERLRKVPIHGV